MILKSSLKYLPVIGWYWILTVRIFIFFEILFNRKEIFVNQVQLKLREL